MAAESLSIHPEALLQHRDFVRALARSLVRDEHAAQDVVQETWLEALRHPPRSGAALRSWLARVVRTRSQNFARGESRRVARERLAARAELDVSEAELRERVALQHKVVEAVLGLREPYRTAVLLHYYEGLTAGQIAARRGLPAGTIRAQLSRAHDLLRERLDAEFGGSRKAWSAGLVVLAREGAALAWAPRIAVLVLAAGGAIAIPAVLWLRSEEEASGPAPLLAAAGAEENPATISAPQPEASEPEAGSSRSAVALEADPATQSPVSREELEGKPVRELLQLAVQVQKAIRAKLLTPSEDLVRSQAVLLGMPSTGLARLIERGTFGTDDVNALGLRGGGYCFSFATRNHNYDDEPDVYLYKGQFFPIGLGPGILDIGEGRLEDLPDDPSIHPRGLDERSRLAWDVFWSDARVTAQGTSEEFGNRSRELRLRPCTPSVGHCYLVRGITPGAHDLLAAIAPLTQDEHGWTIAWRVLRTWPVQRDRGRGQDPYWWVPEAPTSLEELGIDALFTLLESASAVARSKLYAVPGEERDRFAALLSRPETGITRLLSYGRFDAIVERRGGGAYFSFATKEHDFYGDPDVMLAWERYSSGSGNPDGLLLDLGERSIEAVGDTLGVGPSDLSERDSAAWRLLWTMQPSGDSAFEPRDEQRARELGLERGVSATVGHTYLLRSIPRGKHDVLAVFTTAARDEHGDWIVWRVIWNKKLEPTERKR